MLLVLFNIKGRYATLCDLPFDYELNKLWNFNDYDYIIPIDHITFCTTAKIDVLADTRKLKAFVTKSNWAKRVVEDPNNN